ncbi:aldo/keto reductase [Halocatena marina]|uniref:Aldo/keto reductase n=1 Tax=Halocatena marina TaxID=2934937 RepID=A0ABD5YUW5_9EURY|nr:aldo/keto reductase [Halocatena marina]
MAEHRSGNIRTGRETALETGLRYIDTAQYYGNEEAVGDALADDVPRKVVFIGSKVHAEKLGLAHDKVIKG